MFELKAAADAVTAEPRCRVPGVAAWVAIETPHRDSTALRAPRESVRTASPVRSLAAQQIN
jgi:hypothetical protein